MKKGDILLTFCKIDPICWIICLCSKSKWSHTTWILDDKYLIESPSTFTGKTLISHYINSKWYKTKLLRVKEVSPKQIDKAMAYGQTFFKKKNWFVFIWTLLLIAFGYQKKLPEIHCSGFVAHCLSKVGFYFRKDKKTEYITPGDIDKSENTEDV